MKWFRPEVYSIYSILMTFLRFDFNGAIHTFFNMGPKITHLNSEYERVEHLIFLNELCKLKASHNFKVIFLQFRAL